MSKASQHSKRASNVSANRLWKRKAIAFSFANRRARRNIARIMSVV